MSASSCLPVKPRHATPRFCLRTGAQTGQTMHARGDMLSAARGDMLSAARGDMLSAARGDMLSAACSIARSEGGSLAIEIGEPDLHDPLLPDRVRSALQAAALPPARLELAIAETLLTRAGIETLLMLSSLRDLGIGLAMADFGSGDASLSLLRRLPLTVLQLDRTLIAEITHVPQDAAILRAVIQAGHAFDLAIVADGVETPAQSALLAGAGCDLGQGPLWN